MHVLKDHVKNFQKRKVISEPVKTLRLKEKESRRIRWGLVECDIAQTLDGIKIVRALDFLLGE